LTDGLTRQEVQRGADTIDWYHTIDLGDGVVTRGSSQAPVIPDEHLPDLRGKSVLDIGAWDGYYSFRAERSGAERIVALDHYVWCLDWGARQGYWNECRERGELPDPDRDLRDFWLPQEMPGRRGFDFARAVLGSKVEPLVADFMSTDLAALGTFDVVFYFGVLYHMLEPLTALKRVRQVTGEVAVIETLAISVAGYEQESLLSFFPGDEAAADHTNWYAPSEQALIGMCRAAGFRSVDARIGAPPSPARARRRQTPPFQPRVQPYRAVVHAYP
jgi:tRNA (mo5U34)-methyltransferase